MVMAPVLLLGADGTETLVEALDTTAGVHNLLLAGIERMAGGADVQIDVLAQSGAGLDHIAATTGGFDFFVCRMQISFHGHSSVLCAATGPTWSGTALCNLPGTETDTNGPENRPAIITEFRWHASTAVYRPVHRCYHQLSDREGYPPTCQLRSSRLPCPPHCVACSITAGRPGCAPSICRLVPGSGSPSATVSW